MTVDNYEYRTSQTLLRNKFPGKGKFQIPIIPRFEARPGDFDDLLFIGFDKTHLEDTEHLDRMVHFFLYDYRFERVWKSPDNDIERLARYRAVLSPDFSMYLEMAPVMKLYNVFRNRWCGAYWASKGIRVIPTVNWGDEDSFEYCFQGIEKGGTVAVSTLMASESEHHLAQKNWFMTGYNEMLRQLEPERIICYCDPFPEMTGNIIPVDYQRSSWRYLSHESSPEKIDLDCYKIGGANYAARDIMAPYRVALGGGSTRGGGWKPSPSKPKDQRFVGNPGEVKVTGDFLTHIGDDGYADFERHNTDHGTPNAHTNPHDHTIDWSEGFPRFGDHINYPGDVPSFDSVYGGGKAFMKTTVLPKGTPETDRFTGPDDFKWSMKCGGEVQFFWKGKHYGIVRYGRNRKIMLYEAYKEGTEVCFESADDALNYMLDGDRFRDIITKITVTERTI